MLGALTNFRFPAVQREKHDLLHPESPREGRDLEPLHLLVHQLELPLLHLGDLYAESGQTLQGSFSAVSKPNFASKYSLE